MSGRSIVVRRGAAVAAAALAAAGCGGSTRAPVDPSYVPLTVGRGPTYRPPPSGPGSVPAGAACDAGVGTRWGVHIELFAHRHVVIVAAGIGVRGPRFAGAYVRAGRCFDALITLEPTGVVEVGGGRHSVGDLFAAWGQPLSATRLAGFTGGRVGAWVDGRPVGGDPATITLRRHAEIVLEIDGYVPPHRSYDFPPGL